jgi:hypothetical protein
MKTYQELLEKVVLYIKKHGKTDETVAKLETMLPPAWACELIADALDQVD